MSIAMIAGLGNPGPEYVRTRHNAGFEVLDHLAASVQAVWKQKSRFRAMIAEAIVENKPVLLVKPLTWMNLSGESLQPLCHFCRIPASQLAVVYDDITMEPNRIKLSTEGSAGGHNGLASVISHVGPEVIRFRIGIGAKTHPAMELRDYVLGHRTPHEQAAFEAGLTAFTEGLRLLVREGPQRAACILNQKKTSP